VSPPLAFVGEDHRVFESLDHGKSFHLKIEEKRVNQCLFTAIFAQHFGP
jgi:hypothetical protein